MKNRIKNKLLAWFYQQLVLVIFMMAMWFADKIDGALYWAFIFPISGLITLIIVIPISILSDVLTQKTPSSFRLILAFFIHAGVGYTLNEIGVILNTLYWLMDEFVKWRQRKAHW